jgi:hypothetical protein
VAPAAKKGSRSGGKRGDGPASRERREDHSFGELLQTRSVERILPDAMNRIETGRRALVRSAEKTLAGELDLLREERKMLEAEPDADPALIARLDRAMAGVSRDLEAQRGVAAELDQAVVHLAGGWTVFGRVLQRDGTAPKKATVEFVAEAGRPVKELGSLPVGADGYVRKAYAAEAIATIPAQARDVSAVVRVGQRVVARDVAVVDVAADAIYQFDLRVDPIG